MGRVDYEEPDEDLDEVLQELWNETRGIKENTTKRKKMKDRDHERKGSKGRAPVTDYIRSLGPYKSTSEVAEILGKSEGWVRKAATKRWTQAPSYVAPFGDSRVSLYTDEDVEALREYIEKNHTVYKRDDYPYEEK